MKQGGKLKINLFFVCLTICLTVGVLAQIEAIKVIARPILYPSWLLLLLIYVVMCRHKILISPQSKILGLAAASIFVWRMILMITGVMNGLPQLGTLLLIDFAAFLYGTWLAETGFTENMLSKIMVYYSIIVGIFAIYLLKTYFPSIGAWINSLVYQYPSKNSAAQLLAQAILFMIFLYPLVNIKIPSIVSKMLQYGVIGVSLITILLLRCRTAILALCVVAVYYILRWGKKRRLVYLIALLLLSLAVVTIEPLRRFIESALLLNKYGRDATLDQFSSGRLSYIEVALKEWSDHFWLGVGRIVVDCNPLALLVDSGVLGAIPYFIFWLSTVRLNILRKCSDNVFDKVVQLLTVYYCVSSLLEGYPPFGPGVCVAPLWLLSGYCEIKFKSRNLKLKMEDS